jgi:hypothetical protein
MGILFTGQETEDGIDGLGKIIREISFNPSGKEGGSEPYTVGSELWLLNWSCGF